MYMIYNLDNRLSGYEYTHTLPTALVAAFQSVVQPQQICANHLLWGA